MPDGCYCSRCYSYIPVRAWYPGYHDFMQRKLHLNQNPDNCDAARKHICMTSRHCDIGCQTHHKMYCSIMAYWTGRTLVLQLPLYQKNITINSKGNQQQEAEHLDYLEPLRWKLHSPSALPLKNAEVGGRWKLDLLILSSASYQSLLGHSDLDG